MFRSGDVAGDLAQRVCWDQISKGFGSILWIIRGTKRRTERLHIKRGCDNVRCSEHDLQMNYSDVLKKLCRIKFISLFLYLWRCTTVSVTWQTLSKFWLEQGWIQILWGMYIIWETMFKKNNKIMKKNRHMVLEEVI